MLVLTPDILLNVGFVVFFPGFFVVEIFTNYSFQEKFLVTISSFYLQYFYWMRFGDGNYDKVLFNSLSDFSFSISVNFLHVDFHVLIFLRFEIVSFNQNFPQSIFKESLFLQTIFLLKKTFKISTPSLIDFFKTLPSLF